MRAVLRYAPPAVHYRHLSFVDPSYSGPTAPERLADDYIGMLERFSSRIAAIMTAIAHAHEGGVRIHCHAGKDRTGIIAAVLLRLARVSIETASEDYGLTRECMRPLDEEWLAHGPNDRAWREAEYERWHARAETMAEVLGRLEAQHGRVEGYLRPRCEDRSSLARNPVAALPI